MTLGSTICLTPCVLVRDERRRSLRPCEACHANIKMTERYAKLERDDITKTGNTAKVIWSMLDKKQREQEEGARLDVA